eukprot:SAG11_NODE_1674_length_4478_cov_2.341631_1_plen_35_part_00
MRPEESGAGAARRGTSPALRDFEVEVDLPGGSKI